MTSKSAQRLRRARSALFARRFNRRMRQHSLTHAPQVLDGVDPELAADVRRCLEYTMVTPERLVATCDAVSYVARKNIPGALVECGVWRGGTVLAMILTLQRLGINDRELWLYDTFTGMTEPTEHDTSSSGEPATEIWADAAERGQRAFFPWFDPEVFGLEQVRAVLGETGYPEHLIHFVVGPVEETIPGEVPEQIAVLRLDTDWYESTHHELVHLYPRLLTGGVLLIDDYGRWDGARKAVDEYLTEQQATLMLHRTDTAGRAAIKV